PVVTHIRGGTVMPDDLVTVFHKPDIGTGWRVQSLDWSEGLSEFFTGRVVLIPASGRLPPTPPGNPDWMSKWVGQSIGVGLRTAPAAVFHGTVLGSRQDDATSLV